MDREINPGFGLHELGDRGRKYNEVCVFVGAWVEAVGRASVPSTFYPTQLGGALTLLLAICQLVSAEETTTVSAATTLGTLYRQARSEQYGYASRYGSDSSVTSGAIGVRAEPVEHRDAAYFESRCITCDPSKPVLTERGWRQRPRTGYYEDELEERRYRDRYSDYYERGAAPLPAYDSERPRAPGLGYEYDRPRGPAYDYDRARATPYDYDRPRIPLTPYDYNRARAPAYEYDRPDIYTRNEVARPMPVYGDRYDMRGYDRDRNYYEPTYDRPYDRGNGYDNLDQRYQPAYMGRYDRNMSPRRPIDPVDPYALRYERYNRNNYGMRYEPYDRYDVYDRNYWRRPSEDRYPSRGPAPDSRGYYASGAWGPGYERGYASAWNYSGVRDNWRDLNRDRDPGAVDNWRDLNRDRDTGLYRPRDYFHDSTAAPGSGGSRVTSYLHERPESSTKPDSTDRDKATSSPQA